MKLLERAESFRKLAVATLVINILEVVFFIAIFVSAPISPAAITAFIILFAISCFINFIIAVVCLVQTLDLERNIPPNTQASREVQTIKIFTIVNLVTVGSLFLGFFLLITVKKLIEEVKNNPASYNV